MLSVKYRGNVYGIRTEGSAMSESRFKDYGEKAG
jgi:hypothetical protein